MEDKNDLQLLLLLVKRLGLKIVDKSALPNGSDEAFLKQKNIKPSLWKKDKPLSEEELAYHRKIIETGGVMTDDRMKEMLEQLNKDRNDDSRSSRPS
ncbi:MAG: hypothetical protein H6577_15160 [Lewinellaceae bacterium]|nr:hypothetical protein [Saprospiraceae bacterium]MCB9339467.1 hypothetical protein [Lewinellaceae bacterium]